MMFIEAIRSATEIPQDVRIHRPDGPAFTCDDLGQLRLIEDCLYLGDVLDLDDWKVDIIPDVRGPEIIEETGAR